MQGKGFLWEPKVIENLTREGKVTITKARLQFIINLNETTLERHHDEKRGRERETKDKRKEISKNLTADSRNDERVKDVDSRNNMSTSLSAFSNKWKYLTRSRHKLTWKEFLKTFFVNKRKVLRDFRSSLSGTPWSALFVFWCLQKHLSWDVFGNYKLFVELLFLLFSFLFKDPLHVWRQTKVILGDCDSSFRRKVNVSAFNLLS